PKNLKQLSGNARLSFASRVLSKFLKPVSLNAERRLVVLTITSTPLRRDLKHLKNKVCPSLSFTAKTVARSWSTAQLLLT
ncbi:hypothetical protein HDU99_009776, partial [Rhizoclosmatium hyalinum]